MNKNHEWDEKLSQAFQDEAPPDPAGADSRRKEAVRMFNHKMLRLRAYFVFYVSFFLFLMLMYTVIFLEAQSIRAMIGFAVLILMMFEGTVLMKLWYHVTSSKIAVQEEVKQLRMDIAQLARGIPASQGSSPDLFKTEATAPETPGAASWSARWRWAWNLAMGLSLTGMFTALLIRNDLPHFLLCPRITANGAFKSEPTRIELPREWMGPDVEAYIKISMEGWGAGKKGGVCKAQGGWPFGTYDIMSMGQGYGTWELLPGTSELILDPGGRPGTFEVIVTPAKYMLWLCSKWGIFTICAGIATGLGLWRLQRFALRGI